MATPERHFQAGLSLMSKSRFSDAAAQFRHAITLEEENGVARTSMRYVSYLGLSRALARRPTHDDLRCCEEALAREAFDPVLYLNLGKLYLLTGKLTKALATLEQGLKIDPRNAALLKMIAGADRRAKPAFPRLGRDHPVNRSLGRLKAAVSRPEVKPPQLRAVR